LTVPDTVAGIEKQQTKTGESKMKIVAITQKGYEYFYESRTAHKVPEAHAQKVCDVLNKVNYKINDDRLVWHVYDIPEFEWSLCYGQFQKFTYGNTGRVKEVIY
jgi:hypothetical protein